jgi:redox-sensing transcriptional repressor
MVGAGNLGTALASYNGFEHRGFRIVALFDSAPEKIGQQLGHITVQPLEEISEVVQRTRCQVAVLAVPADAAQAVSELLIESGIGSILCYAPITLSVPASVRVEYIDPVIHFQHMTYYLRKGCIEDE